MIDAAGLERYALLGISQGCAIAVAHAVRHPERVSGLVLYGGYAQGWRVRGDPQELDMEEAMLTLVAHGWGRPDPAFRQLFTSLFFPGATLAQMNAFNELQRRSTSPANAVRLERAFGDLDVSTLLRQVRVPTLVLHARDDRVVPFEQGRLLASPSPAPGSCRSRAPTISSPRTSPRGSGSGPRCASSSWPSRTDASCQRPA